MTPVELSTSVKAPSDSHRACVCNSSFVSLSFLSSFLQGLVGGTIWHTVGGARNAPKGQRIAQAISRARARVPILGGSFAVWGLLFSCCDCTFTYVRKKVSQILFLQDLDNSLSHTHTHTHSLSLLL
jgi:hypothetical protein